MVASQLRPSGVNNPRVIAAMALVPREWFVPADKAGVAYSDRPVALGRGREMNAPIVTGRLLNELDVREGERVLLVGAAGGYAAALLATLGARVTAIEEDPVLAGAARDALARGEGAVTLVETRLAAGHAADAPYDVIMIDGAIERIPNTLVAQLADGGRLGAALIDNRVPRLVLGRRTSGGFGVSAFADADAVPLPGFGRPPAFTF